MDPGEDSSFVKVAYVCLDPGVLWFGSKGASKHVREFAATLDGLGHQVRVFVARMGESDGNPCHYVQQVPDPATEEKIPRGLAQEIRNLDRNAFLRRSLEEAHRREPFDLVYERYSLWNHGALAFAEDRGLPFVLEVNSPLRIEQKKYRELRLEGAAEAVEQLLFRSATLVVGVSRNVADYVQRRSQRTRPPIIVPNGVDLKLFARVPTTPANAHFTIGFVGSLKRWHGIEILLEAFRMLVQQSGDYRLLVVGDGPLRTWIDDYTQTHDLSSFVEVTGSVPKSSVPAFLGRVDVAVAPYPDLDDFYFSPLKLFEYMAAGRAIVASDIGQISELVVDGETALLVKPGDAAELAEKVRRLRANPQLQHALGERAQQEAFARHGWEWRVKTILNSLPGMTSIPPVLDAATSGVGRVHV